MPYLGLIMSYVRVEWRLIGNDGPQASARYQASTIMAHCCSFCCRVDLEWMHTIYRRNSLSASVERQCRSFRPPLDRACQLTQRSYNISQDTEGIFNPQQMPWGHLARQLKAPTETCTLSIIKVRSFFLLRCIALAFASPFSLLLFLRVLYFLEQSSGPQHLPVALQIQPFSGKSESAECTINNY